MENIDEKDFGTIQKGGLKEMQKWAKAVKNIKNKLSIVIVPAWGCTATGFRNVTGQPEAMREEIKEPSLDR